MAQALPKILGYLSSALPADFPCSIERTHPIRSRHNYALSIDGREISVQGLTRWPGTLEDQYGLRNARPKVEIKYIALLIGRIGTLRRNKDRVIRILLQQLVSRPPYLDLFHPYKFLGNSKSSQAQIPQLGDEGGHPIPTMRS